MSRSRSPKVDLLQPSDEYFVAYAESRSAIDASGRVGSHKGRPPAFFGAVILDGQLVGHWKRTLNKGEILIEAELYQRLDGAQSEALLDAGDRYGKFQGLPTSVEVSRL